MPSGTRPGSGSCWSRATRRGRELHNARSARPHSTTRPRARIRSEGDLAPRAAADPAGTDTASRDGARRRRPVGCCLRMLSGWSEPSPVARTCRPPGRLHTSIATATAACRGPRAATPRSRGAHPPRRRRRRGRLGGDLERPRGVAFVAELFRDVPGPSGSTQSQSRNSWSPCKRPERAERRRTRQASPPAFHPADHPVRRTGKRAMSCIGRRRQVPDLCAFLPQESLRSPRTSPHG